MTDEENGVYIEKPEGHFCFACGTANPIGLKLSFYALGDTVRSEITLGKYHEGWENVAHGGIVSTLLDEVMSWTVMYSKRTFVVTRKMDFKYVKNVPIGVPLTVTGRIIDDSSPPKVKVRGEVRDHEGSLLVRSGGEFVLLPEEKLAAVPDAFKREMGLLFESFRQTALGGEMKELKGEVSNGHDDG